jgi:methionyl aminopeptidase
MAKIKQKAEIERMYGTCQIAAETLEYLKSEARPGVSTLDLDVLAIEFIKSRDAISSTLGYRGYPNSICTAVNDVVVHGIPTSEPLNSGDIITIDVTVYKNGFHGDKAGTIIVGDVANERGQRLMKITEESMYRGIAEAKPGGRLGNVGAAVQEHAEAHGYGVVQDLTGHGIGRQFHEEPMVPNYGHRGTGRRLRPGMVFTVEPMINEGSWEVGCLDDGWTIKTIDGKLSAQYEHTIAVTPDGPRILTLHTDHERAMWDAELARQQELEV